MHYILTKNTQWIEPLQRELIQDLDTQSQKLRGLPVVTIDETVNLENKYIAFSTSALINTKLIPEDSISKQANQIVELIKEKVESEEFLNLHVFSMTQKYGVIETGRAEILKDKIYKSLRKERVKILRKEFNPSKAHAQVMILDDRSAVISIQSKEEVSNYRTLYSPYIGGFNNVEDDKKAPSRAFKKIVEAQEIMGKKISAGETLIDLGACPGGWTYIARKNGASVIAIDRSELREDLMLDPEVTFLQTDAFKYRPEETLDWAVSDIISTPERVIELIETWVVGELCHNFIFTIKFQGSDGYNILTKFKDLAKKCTFNIILKQLNANKNEVTIMGSKQS
ncbi:conserved hypothetical protein [Halobacteriovorax marinus SJ]|uniref:Ribosomal RNA methyltransferase FtsJ domain-containing protein n=1 Tax=Halobacteriovorax marinus (strain ATCC BAA-682 / DSM 15412 / SJ) TaxID=862908 RepID=E1WX72_HALMS|nr:SAM-dependent methyltransferase [Halobacteriovorax marinus]CBW25773.1 conserved hypothetical protein [Halobacteriovorax marinus SJ]